MSVRQDARRWRATQEASEWNQTVPVGTLVRFWKGAKGDGPGRESRTNAPAEEFHGTAVVWMECGGGCIALSHVEVIG